MFFKDFLGLVFEDNDCQVRDYEDDTVLRFW